MAWWRRAIVASELLSLRSGEEPVEDDGDAAGCGNRGRGPLRRGFMQAIGEEALSREDGHPRGPLNVLPPGCGCQAGWASGQAGGDGFAEGVAAGGGGPQAHRPACAGARAWRGRFRRPASARVCARKPGPARRLSLGVRMGMSGISIRPARAGEGPDLTELALRAKSHWGYGEPFLAAARATLTIDAETISSARVYVAEQDGATVGFYGLTGEPPSGVLEWMFLEPHAIGRGYGRRMWDTRSPGPALPGLASS